MVRTVPRDIYAKVIEITSQLDKLAIHCLSDI